MFFPENLERLDISSRQVLERLLRAVATWCGGYFLEEGFDERPTSRKKIWTGLRLVFTGGGAPPPTEHIFSPNSMMLDWFNLEIAVPIATAPDQASPSSRKG